MIGQVFGAAVRAFLVALLVVSPTALLPSGPTEAAQIAVLAAMTLGLMVFFEYRSAYPSLIGFRSAPPFNRVRFAALACSVLGATLIARAALAGAEGAPILALGRHAGTALDFPFSPVRLMRLSLPEGGAGAHAALVASLAGLVYFVALGAALVFVAIVRLLDWPLQTGAFNVWVNLPLFDPTAGGDVLLRLQRTAQINVALGFLLPFLIPAALQATSLAPVLLDPARPQLMVWVICAWGVLPTSMVMRGFAVMRVADLIAEKRRRAYRQSSLRPV